MSLPPSLPANLFIGDVAWTQQLSIEPSLNGSEEATCALREDAEILLFENVNAILTKFIDVEEVVATDRIAVLMPTLDKLTDCENCSALESEISWIQGQHQRERDALMDKLLALEKSLSEAVAANERDRKAWEKKQKQQKEETDRERKAWGHQQQQAVERQKRQMLEQMGQERQTQQQQSAVTNKALRELRSDVDVLVQFSDVYVLDLAAEVLERFLKRPKSGGASWSASSIFRDRERDVVRTALQQGGVQYDVGRFAELAAHLLNSRRSVTHFADDGADLRSAQRS